MSASNTIRKTARSVGSLAEGAFRVMVLESDLRLRHRDFKSLDEAKRYANDVASESDVPAPLAWVFDSRFEVVCEGRHYGIGIT